MQCSSCLETNHALMLSMMIIHAPQVMYARTGRLFVVTCGILASTCLTIGMWMFIMTSSYFLWYAVPTVFLTVYLVAHCEYESSSGLPRGWWGDLVMTRNAS